MATTCHVPTICIHVAVISNRYLKTNVRTTHVDREYNNIQRHSFFILCKERILLTVADWGEETNSMCIQLFLIIHFIYKELS